MLVAAPERWDEACFMAPALRALMASGLRVGVLCPAHQAEFWATLPDLEVMILPRKWRELAAQIAGKWRVALLWETGVAANVVCKAAIPHRMGPEGGWLTRKLTHPFKTTEPALEHRVKYYLSAAERMSIQTADPAFFAPADIGIEPMGHAVLLSPESDFGPSHEWQADNWREIGKRLINCGFRVTVAGMSKANNRMAETLARELGEGVEFFHASPLAGTLPLLAVHGMVIAVDSSLPHMAAHVGTTCVTLFGPNDPHWKRPLGKRHAVLSHHVECAPCLMPKCPLDMRCQRELLLDQVWDCVCEKLV